MSSTIKPSGVSSDYGRIAARYDETRALPTEVLHACYDGLLALGVIEDRCTVLDHGCGTGQLSLPLAARGFRVRGVDISQEMVRLANAKVKPGWDAHYAAGDVRDIAFADATFDTVVVSKLFQHVEDWRQGCRELIRVTRPGGCIIQINERGAFGNAVRRRFALAADALGFTRRYPGLDPYSDAEPATFMTAQGCTRLVLDMPTLGWRTEITYGEALRRLQDRLFAEFWYLPSDVNERLIAETSRWIDLQPAGPATVQVLEPFLVVQAFRTPSMPPDPR